MKSHRYQEIRFLLNQEGGHTHVYVGIQTTEDGKEPELVWHFKTFDKSMTILEIVRSFSESLEDADPIAWPRKNPNGYSTPNNV